MGAKDCKTFCTIFFANLFLTLFLFLHFFTSLFLYAFLHTFLRLHKSQNPSKTTKTPTISAQDSYPNFCKTKSKSTQIPQKKWYNRATSR